MIDHVSIACADLARAAAFYDAVFAALGKDCLVRGPNSAGYGSGHPEFWINLRADMIPVTEDSGMHVCLRARDTETVDAFHAAALAHGGGDDGAPGLRTEYAPNYYVAFVRDPDGNRIEAVTFIKPVQAA